MKYRVTLDERERDVDVQISPSGAISVTLDGHAVDADIIQVDGGINLKMGNRVFDLVVGGKSDALQIAVGAHRSNASVQSERTRSQKRGGTSKGAGGKEVRSPMPGRVVKILVSVGDDVAPQSPVVVVEAMKMENELRTPAGGKVEAIFAKAGDTVEGNALLIKFA